MYGSSVFWNRQGVGIGVMGGSNIALRDLAGKLLNVPVYQLLVDWYDRKPKFRQ